MKTLTLPLLAVCLAALLGPAGAADWPQWRGPNRNDISPETGLLKTWSRDGPPLLWTATDAGIGYSAPAIVGKRLYSIGDFGKSEQVFALDTQNGKKVWATEIGPRFDNDWADGPRSTPTVDGELLFALGGQGNLVCLETKTGKKRWSLNMRKDLGGEMMSGWGYSESPLVDGDKLVCSPGGAGGTLAALDKKTGKVLWRSKELKDRATYSSIIVAEVGGVRQYIQTTHGGQSEGAVVGVAARDGRLLWRVPREGYRTAVIPTPIFHDNSVYVTAGYGAGCDLIKLIPDATGTRAERVYTNKNLKNHHGGVVLVKGKIYGYSDGNGWVCQDLSTGKVLWEDKNVLDKGSLTFADGQLYCYSEKDGTVVLAEATPAGWKENGRFKIPRESKQPRKRAKIWTHPVVADGRLYLRDLDLIFCFDIKGK